MRFEVFAPQDFCSLEWMQKLLQYDVEGGSRTVWNFDLFLPDYTVLYSWRLHY